MRLEDGGSGTWLAYTLIVVFIVLMAAIVLRTVLLLSVLLILPLARALRRVPGMPVMLDRLQARATAANASDVRGG